MRNKFLKATAGIAAFAAVAALAPLSPTVSAAPPFPAAGTMNLAPGSGTSGTTFGLPFTTTPQFCPGDAVANYRWSTFITPASEVAPTTWTASGNPNGPGVTLGLRTSAGVQIRAQNPGLGDGLVVAPIDVSFNNLNYAPLAANPGAYSIGVACTLAVGGVVTTQRYWTAPITITAAPVSPTNPQGFTWAFGAVPAAPVLATSSYNAGTTTATVNFTHAASVPATTGYTATLVPVGAAAPIAPISVPAGATSFQIPGVVLGAEYDVTLVATNSTGNSDASNTLRVAGAAVTPAPAVGNVSAFEGTAATITWTAPASGPAPASYDVTVAGPTAVGPFLGETGTSVTIPAGANLATGIYTVTVSPNYAAGSGVTGTPGTGTLTVNPNALIFQEISVERPQGALILTQRCGVFGDLPAFGAVDAFPGFPRNLSAAAASADQVGTSPDIDLGTPGVQADPEFGNYPFPQPATYPTECGLDMGTARFVTSGALAGQFYTADGRLNQVTVLDTRDVDAGWVARGAIEDFTSGADTFDGNYLGWVPVMTDDSDPVGGSTYDQVVSPGGTVLPGTGTPGDAGAGLKSNVPLAFANAGAGLGIATLDARMLLLIPASADAGDYNATLSLTVA